MYKSNVKKALVVYIKTKTILLNKSILIYWFLKSTFKTNLGFNFKNIFIVSEQIVCSL